MLHGLGSLHHTLYFTQWQQLSQNGLPMPPPRTYGDTPISSDNEGSNPNTNDIPAFFTTNHYKWLLKYQQLFQFYVVHGHTNVIRVNADNSLVEWVSYQRAKMGAVDKCNPKWKQLLNGSGFCCSPPSTPNQVLNNNMASYNALSGTRNAITPKKADNKALYGGWKYWRQQGKYFLLREFSKIKDQDRQTLFVLFSTGIFSGI
jgi:hypothetical protein